MNEPEHSSSSVPPRASPVRTRNRQTRGKGIRRTTGCITCRKRHVKCDESQPACNRCQKGNYTCIYATSSSKSRSLDLTPAIDRRDNSLSTNPNSGGDRGFAPEQDTVRHRIAGSIASPLITLKNAVNPETDQGDIHQTQHAASPHESPTAEFLHPASINSNRLHVHSLRDNNPGSPFIHTNPAESRVQYVTSPDGISAYRAAGYSANSTVSTSGVEPVSSPEQLSYNAAISRWFDLVATDADLDASQFFDSIESPPAQRSSARHTQSNAPGLIGGTHEGFPIAGHHRTLSTTSSSLQLKERDPDLDALKAAERQQWQSSEPLKLQHHENALFHNFINHTSLWIDFFDPWRNFSTFVPHLAMHNVGLMKAILTLSARHISLNPGANQQTHDRNDALQFYNETLHFVAGAMQYDSYKTSLELLATALIISTYEMLDGEGMDWERHLRGVFLIQRSQVIHGDSKGLKQAVWWAWLCQDIWAAFRENRKTFTFWKPVRKYDAMNAHELAVRSVFLVARVIDYCSREEVEACGGNIMARIQEADRLTKTLEEWHQSLTAEFNPLPWGHCSSTEVFKPIWIHPPSHAVAIQLYNTAQLLLLINRPSRGGLDEFLLQAKIKGECIANICGIATTLTDYASSVLSSQCVYIAGTCAQDSKQRDAISCLLRIGRERTGWPIKSLEQELLNLWNGIGAMEVYT